jgi:hypothetical protein
MGMFITRDQPILIWTGSVTLDGVITIPRETPAIVLIAGLGFTTRQTGFRTLAAKMNHSGIATLLADILTPEEQQFDSRTGHFRVELPMLAGRISSVVRWIEKSDMTRDLPVAFFGSSVAGTAGLLAAADGTPFCALVLNRPRLALVPGEAQRVTAPILFIEDSEISLAAAVRLDRKGVAPPHRFETVAGATDLSQDAVAAAAVANHAVPWFQSHAPLAVA